MAGGSVDELREFINFGTGADGDDRFRLAVGWQLAALSGRGPFPILAIYGEQDRCTPNDKSLRLAEHLDARLVEVTGYGPLAAQGAAVRVSTTKWLLPTGQGGGENRVLLHFPGLIVQILSPPTHFLPATAAPLRVPFRANVTMMCGCPVGPEYPWRPEDYQVTALITEPSGTRHELPLQYDLDAPDKAPSQFVGSWIAPTAGVYEAVVTAYQRSYDNTGVDHVTFILP